MNTFIFRNHTIECFFKDHCSYSGYGDIHFEEENVDCFVWFYQLPLKYDNQLLAEEVLSYLEKFLLTVKSVPSTKPLIALTMESRGRELFVINDRTLQNSIDNYNQNLYLTASAHRNVKVLDISEFTYSYNASELINWKFYFTAQIALNPQLANNFREWFDLKSKQLNLVRKKCIIADLDNTLWGGILGEDGPTHLAIGGSYPGNVFRLFQEALINLSKTGILIAICSKNNEHEVLKFWKENSDNLINTNNIVAHRINWNSKSDNIIEIAQELNIGLDSIVFIDDNPVERAAVREALPMVSVPDFPNQPYMIPQFINQLDEEFFKTYELTDEDKLKTSQYQTAKVRQTEKANFANLEDFLKKLDIRLTIAEGSANNITRIAQLTQKTNQFNLTTHRYTETEIATFIDEGWKIFSVSVTDKFGEYGQSGCILINGNTIDTFVLSCRVLGLGIETAFITAVLQKMKDLEIVSANAMFIPSEKNQIGETFYESIGFICNKNTISGEKHYTIDLSKTLLKIKDYYNITFK